MKLLILFVLMFMLCFVELVQVKAQMPPNTMQNLKQIKRYPAITFGLVAYYQLDGTSEDRLSGLTIRNPLFSSPGNNQEYYLSNRITNNSYAGLSGKNTATLALWCWFNDLTGAYFRGLSVGNATIGQFAIQKGSDPSRLNISFYSSTPSEVYKDIINMTYSTGVWFHIAATVNIGGNEYPIVYVNGVKLATAQNGVGDISTRTIAATNLIIGSSFIARSQDICVYDRVLSSNEVYQLYRGFVAPP